MRNKIVAALLATAALPGVARAQDAPAPFTTATRYDAAHRATGTIAAAPGDDAPAGFIAVRNTYDAAGQLVRVETGILGSWHSEAMAPADWPDFTVNQQVDTKYDLLGRKLVERTSSGGTVYQMTQYSYNDQGLLKCTAVRMDMNTFGSDATDACSLTSTTSPTPDRITRNEYDAAGQLLQVRRAVGTTLEQGYATYAYSPTGKQSDVVDANGNHAHMAYDNFDRLLRWEFPSTARPTNWQDTDAATAMAHAGAANAPTLDSNGMPVAGTGDYEGSGYDANGNRTSWRKRDARTFAFTYDALNRVTHKTEPTGCAPIHVSGDPCPAGSATRDVYNQYDLASHLTSAHFDSATGPDGVENGYDGFGRQRTSNVILNGAPPRLLTFGYDAEGNRTSIEHPDHQVFGTRFDGLNREAKIYEGPVETGTLIDRFGYQAHGERASGFDGGVTYGYDPVGRLHALGITVGAANAMTLEYNPASQIVLETRDNDAYAFTGLVNAVKAYEPNGLNQYDKVGGTKFTYDPNGNLLTDDTSRYTYDAENRLISGPGGSKLSYDPLGRLWQVTAAAGTTQFLYDGDQLTAEYDGSGTLLRRYVHGTAEDDPLFWYEGAGVGPANRRALVADHEGSIVQVVDGNGQKLAIDSYDEYGQPAASNLGRFQYTGQAWLPELGIYHYKARAYSPKLGRFLQTDPVGYKDQVNLYAYVANDPVNGTDPTGNSCEPATGTRICTETKTEDHTYRDTLAAGGAAAGAVLGGVAGGAAGGTGGALAGAACGPGAVACSPAAAAAGGTIGATEGAVLGGTAGGVVGGLIGNLIDKGIAMMSSSGDGGKGGGQGSGGSSRNLGNLGGRAGERAADVATSRGASGANVRQMGPWADKPLGEVAKAAATGDRSAATALKIVKQASRLGQKY